MPNQRRRIRPEVLRPFILVAAIIVALFVLQFLRPTPPDIRAQDLQKAYTADLQRLYAAVQQYQAQYQVVPEDWQGLAGIGFDIESLDLPDAQPRHPVVAREPGGPQVRNMPFTLLQKGRVDFAGPRRPLIEFKGTKEAPPATLYTDGTIEWGKRSG